MVKKYKELRSKIFPKKVPVNDLVGNKLLTRFIHTPWNGLATMDAFFEDCFLAKYFVFSNQQNHLFSPSFVLEFN